jgi:acyl carrier protein
MTETVNEILELIHEAYQIEPASIDPGKPLADFGLDSLSLAELVFAIEDHFNIAFPQDRRDIGTLVELADVVDEVRAAAHAA